MLPFWRRGHPPLGARGEELARRFLKRRGMKILARNYRCPAGEADLIALDPTTRKQFGAQTIVIAEVKTRRCDRYTSPAGAVDAEKRRRLQKVADYYVTTRHAGELNLRFDIVSVVIPEGHDPRIEYIPDAF